MSAKGTQNSRTANLFGVCRSLSGYGRVRGFVNKTSPPLLLNLRSALFPRVSRCGLSEPALSARGSFVNLLCRPKHERSFFILFRHQHSPHKFGSAFGLLKRFKFLHLFRPQHSSNKFGSALGLSKRFKFLHLFSPRQSRSKLRFARSAYRKGFLQQTFSRLSIARISSALPSAYRKGSKKRATSTVTPCKFNSKCERKRENDGGGNDPARRHIAEHPARCRTVLS